MARSAARVLEILEAVGTTEAQATHTWISRHLGIPKSSLTSLLKELLDAKYLVADDSGAYRLGPRLLLLSNVYLQRYNPFRDALLEVAKLCRSLGETVHISVLEEDTIVVLHQETGRHAPSSIMKPGERAPALGTAAGTALSAFSDPAELDRRLDEAVRAGWVDGDAGRKKFLADLKQVREGGVASIRSPYIRGLTGFAVPLFNAGDGSAFAAISVVVPNDALDDDVKNRIIEALQSVRNRFPRGLAPYHKADRDGLQS